MINRAAAASFAALLLAIAGGTRAAQTVPDLSLPANLLDALRDGVDRGDPGDALVRMAVEIAWCPARVELRRMLDYLNAPPNRIAAAAHCALGMMYMCGRYGTNVDIATAQEHLKPPLTPPRWPRHGDAGPAPGGKTGHRQFESTALYQKAYPAVKRRPRRATSRRCSISASLFFAAALPRTPELEVALVPEGGRGRHSRDALSSLLHLMHVAKSADDYRTRRVEVAPAIRRYRRRRIPHLSRIFLSSRRRCRTRLFRGLRLFREGRRARGFRAP